MQMRGWRSLLTLLESLAFLLATAVEAEQSVVWSSSSLLPDNLLGETVIEFSNM